MRILRSRGVIWVWFLYSGSRRSIRLASELVARFLGASIGAMSSMGAELSGGSSV